MKKQASPTESAMAVSLLFLIICGALISASWNNFRGAIFTPSRAYRMTLGTIAQSESRYTGGKGGGYKYRVRFTYQVGSQFYSSSQVSFGAWGGTRDFVEGVVRKYPIGARVPVYYKFDEPSFAVLEPHNVGQSIPAFWFSVVFSIGGLFGVVRSGIKCANKRRRRLGPRKTDNLKP